MKANVRPEEINLFINTPYWFLLSRRSRKKPRNYREELSYVNLETTNLPGRVKHLSYREHLYVCTSRECLDLSLDPALIFFIANNFRAQYQGCGNWAWMPGSLGPFATRKPAFWCQKNEDQNDHTEKVPLPGIARVIPEKNLFKCGEKASHDLEPASMQPREPRLVGRLILTQSWVRIGLIRDI